MMNAVSRRESIKTLNLSILFSLVLIISSCSSAKWIKKDSDNRQGTISYITEGKKDQISKRRNEALKEIESFCGGTYKIISETDKFNSMTRYPIDNSYSPQQKAAALSMNQPTKNAHILFECE